MWAIIPTGALESIIHGCHSPLGGGSISAPPTCQHSRLAEIRFNSFQDFLWEHCSIILRGDPLVGILGDWIPLIPLLNVWPIDSHFRFLIILPMGNSPQFFVWNSIRPAYPNDMSYEGLELLTVRVSFHVLLQSSNTELDCCVEIVTAYPEFRQGCRSRSSIVTTSSDI